MLAYALTFFLSGFALFLLGLSIFMYRENRKFGDNQFTVKLLPPPPRLMREPATGSWIAVTAEGHPKTHVGPAAGYVREESPARVLPHPV